MKETQNNEQEMAADPQGGPSGEGSRQGAEESVAATGASGAVNLADLPEFREYQSSVDRQLAERDQQLKELQQQMEALQATREYEQQQVEELRDQQEQQRALQQRKQQMAAAWGDMPGWDNSILDGAKTVDQIEQRVYDFLRGMGKSQGQQEAKPQEDRQDKQRKQEVTETGVDESPGPSTSARSPVQPPDLSEQAQQWRREVREEGADRLKEWLSATEPVYPTQRNQQGQGGSGKSMKSKV